MRTGKGQTRAGQRTRDDELAPIRIAPARVDLPRRGFDVRPGTARGQASRQAGRQVRASRCHEAASVSLSVPLSSAYRKDTQTHCTHGASDEETLGCQAALIFLLSILPLIPSHS